MALTFENPPKHDDPSVMSRDDIMNELESRPGEWAIVGKHDRAARAQAQADRIDVGDEYGDNFSAVTRRVGPEHRVYARKNKR